jgi:serine protease AprX
MALIALLLFATILPTPQVLATPRAHPALVQFAADHPTAMVAVIVQQTNAGQTAAATARRLGGVITMDLRLINAFAVHMPAVAAIELARAPGVRWVAPDAPVVRTGSSSPCRKCSSLTTTSTSTTAPEMLTTYPLATGASRLWQQRPDGLMGQGMTVVIVDSGINHLPDLAGPDGSGPSRVLRDLTFNWNAIYADGWDQWGHGTHVAGIIGGNGASSGGRIVGIAPKVNLINTKVGDGKGAASTADVVAALEWIYNNAATYNIRVVNLSLTSTVAESYHTSALNAAIELLWFKGIVVVVAGGNNGQSSNVTLYPPANDPFVISVGALDDRGTPDVTDDLLAPFSAYGTTTDGIAKPDLVAPGVNIVSLLASRKAILAQDHPDHFVDGFAGAKDYYFRMSGTSMASAVVAGSVALLLQDEPGLTPDQVKYRLVTTARKMFYPGAGAGALDIYSAVTGTTTQSANQGVMMSQMLWTDATPVEWGAANWGAANWGAANWGAANWGSLPWD